MTTPAAPPLLSLNGKFTAQRLTGVQRHATELLRALDTLLAAHPGHALHRRPPVLWVPPGAPGLGLRVIRQHTLPGPLRPGSATSLHLWEQWALPRAARGSLLLSLAGSAPAFAARQVATLHDAALWDHPQAYTASFRHWYRWLFRRLAGRAEALLTVSAFSRSRLSQALQVPAARLRVVPGGSGHLHGLAGDETVLSRLGLTHGRYFLAVASANPSKNLALLQRAHALFAAQVRAAGGVPAPLVLVGGAAPRVFAAAGPPGALAGRPMDAQADAQQGAQAGARAGARLGAVAPDIRPAGVVDDAALKALYTHALALVCPSLYEGFGLPVLEAMACGCPVLAARAASLPEVAGAAALYVDATDDAALAAALQRLATDPALRQQLRRAGLRRAADWPWAASAEALLAVLEAALGLPPSPAAALHPALLDALHPTLETGADAAPGSGPWTDAAVTSPAVRDLFGVTAGAPADGALQGPQEPRP